MRSVGMHRRPSHRRRSSSRPSANFQRTDNRFFSSKALKAFAEGGPAPDLPQGHTASERRGREFFVDAPWNPPSKKGVCALCHSGPMLNTANEFTTVPDGGAAWLARVRHRGELAQPHEQPGPHVRGHRSVQQHHRGGVAGSRNHDDRRLQHPDAGAIPSAQGVLHPPSRVLREHVQDAAASRREVYGAVLHDNSAKDLEAVLEQYAFMFTSNSGFPLTDSNIFLTEQDIKDIIAFLRLL